MLAKCSAAVVLMLSLFVLLLAGCDAQLEDPVTRENYDRVEMGMTPQQVEAILGQGDVEDSAGVVMPGMQAQARMMRWESNDRSITVTFIDGEAVAKTQSGL